MTPSLLPSADELRELRERAADNDWNYGDGEDLRLVQLCARYMVPLLDHYEELKQIVAVDEQAEAQAKACVERLDQFKAGLTAARADQPFDPSESPTWQTAWRSVDKQRTQDAKLQALPRLRARIEELEQAIAQAQDIYQVGERNGTDGSTPALAVLEAVMLGR